MSSDIQVLKAEVAEEIHAALDTFMSEGFATRIGFDTRGEVLTAEVYGDEGQILDPRFMVSFTITEATA